ASASVKISVTSIYEYEECQKNEEKVSNEAKDGKKNENESVKRRENKNERNKKKKDENNKMNGMGMGKDINVKYEWNIRNKYEKIQKLKNEQKGMKMPEINERTHVQNYKVEKKYKQVEKLSELK
ncbi:18251_t:CDS:2, partial [Dentiscutata erythropus]